MISYHPFDSQKLDEIKAIYASENWKTYLNDDEKLKRAFAHSLDVYGAFDDEQLVGFIRTVGDGEHIVVIQDLIVLKKYQKQGIGTRLLHSILDQYKEVRMVTLFTDAYDKLDNYFYPKHDFQLIIEKDMVAYIKRR